MWACGMSEWLHGTLAARWIKPMQADGFIIPKVFLDLVEHKGVILLSFNPEKPPSLHELSPAIQSGLLVT